ncbi:MAG TPA: hypothetical protein VN671_02555 [Solirubrobacterales bacterium]|nr:hypothetical protein [Solirubrobacterales bacterium]
MNIDLGSPILDVAIGLSFVFFLLSVIASAIGEGIASVLNWRGKTLEQGLTGMLKDPAAVTSLLEHDLVRTELDKKPRSEAPGWRLGLERFLPKWKRKYERSSSYIAPEVFAAAFKDLYGDLKGQPVIAAQLNALGVTGAWGVFQNDLKKIEKWFDRSMERVSGWYRRKSQLITVAIAILLAAGLNASALRIVERLQQEPTVRTALVAQAEATAEDDSTTTAEKEESLEHAGKAAAGAYDKLTAMHVPLLWAKANVPHGFLPWVTNVIGWLLTIVAISLGAPFWFDALGKLANLRTTGKKPEPKTTG